MFGSRVEVGDSVSIGLITKSNCRRSFAQDAVTALKDLPRLPKNRNGLRFFLFFFVTEPGMHVKYNLNFVLFRLFLVEFFLFLYLFRLSSCFIIYARVNMTE